MTEVEKDAGSEAAEGPAAEDEKGERVYSEAGNKKAQRIRTMLALSGALYGIGFLGIAVFILILAFFSRPFPILVQVFGALLAGALLYWAFLGFYDFMRTKKALRPLKVYEHGVRLPCGSEYDVSHGHPPRFIAFSEIEAFYPNEGETSLPEFVVTLKDADEDPVVVSKEFVGNWGRFRKAVKDKVEVRKGWVYLKGEGPLFAGHVESDDLHLFYGPKEQKTELSWDAVADTPRTKLKVLKGFAVLTVKLREGRDLRFLMRFGETEGIIRDYKRYVDRFWKEPEKEEERWEKVGDSEEEEES